MANAFKWIYQSLIRGNWSTLKPTDQYIPETRGIEREAVQPRLPGHIRKGLGKGEEWWEKCVLGVHHSCTQVFILQCTRYTRGNDQGPVLTVERQRRVQKS